MLGKITLLDSLPSWKMVEESRQKTYDALSYRLKRMGYPYLGILDWISYDHGKKRKEIKRLFLNKVMIRPNHLEEACDNDLDLRPEVKEWLLQRWVEAYQGIDDLSHVTYQLHQSLLSETEETLHWVWCRGSEVVDSQTKQGLLQHEGLSDTLLDLFLHGQVHVSVLPPNTDKQSLLHYLHGCFPHRHVTLLVSAIEGLIRLSAIEEDKHHQYRLTLEHHRHLRYFNDIQLTLIAYLAKIAKWDVDTLIHVYRVGDIEGYHWCCRRVGPIGDKLAYQRTTGYQCVRAPTPGLPLIASYPALGYQFYRCLIQQDAQVAPSWCLTLLRRLIRWGVYQQRGETCRLTPLGQQLLFQFHRRYSPLPLQYVTSQRCHITGCRRLLHYLPRERRFDCPTHGALLQVKQDIPSPLLCSRCKGKSRLQHFEGLPHTLQVCEDTLYCGQLRYHDSHYLDGVEAIRGKDRYTQTCPKCHTRLIDLSCIQPDSSLLDCPQCEIHYQLSRYGKLHPHVKHVQYLPFGEHGLQGIRYLALPPVGIPYYTDSRHHPLPGEQSLVIPYALYTQRYLLPKGYQYLALTPTHDRDGHLTRFIWDKQHHTLGVVGKSRAYKQPQVRWYLDKDNYWQDYVQ